jgi:hypothetical protein
VLLIDKCDCFSFYNFYYVLLSSAAYRLAGSFNFRGRLRQIFGVLTDDKVGSGPRPAPHSLQHPGEPEKEASGEDQASAANHDHDYDVEMVSQGSQSVKRKSDTEPGRQKRR